MTEPESYMPSFSYPCSLAAGLEEYNISEKVSGDFSYEVISKDEHGIGIRISGLNVDGKKRKFT